MVNEPRESARKIYGKCTNLVQIIYLRIYFWVKKTRNILTQVLCCCLCVSSDFKRWMLPNPHLMASKMTTINQLRSAISNACWPEKEPDEV